VQYFDWISEAKIADAAIANWMHSPGHRANLLAAMEARRHRRRRRAGPQGLCHAEFPLDAPEP
jgi:hypothetical protein